MAIFISKLPKQLEPDQVVPDIDWVISLIMSANLDALPTAAGGEQLDQGMAGKRQHEELNQQQQHSPLYTAVYRMRQKQRIEGS